MNKWLPLSLVCFSSMSFASNDISTQIVNGSDASVSNYPSIVSLLIDQIDYDGLYSISPYCGATLLDSQHILTAAHCFYGDEQSELFTVVVPQLQLKSDFPSQVSERVRVAEFYYPSTYNHSTLKDDIAILKLESPLTSIQASDYLNLPVVGQDATYRDRSQNFVAVGHGNAQTGISSSDSLQYAQLKYVTNDVCNYRVTTDNNLCMEGDIGFSGLENATCQGDSGGPLYWSDGSTQVQVGITSFGPNTQCGEPDTSFGATSVFTEVHDYVDWIQDVLNGVEQPKIRVDDDDREAFFNGGTTSNVMFEESGGATLGGIFALVFLALGRRRLVKT